MQGYRDEGKLGCIRKEGPIGPTLDYFTMFNGWGLNQL